MLKSKLSTLIEKIAKDDFGEEIKVFLQKPPKRKFGDFSTNVAMQIASRLSKKPQEIGESIIRHLEKELDKDKFLKQEMENIKFVPPGFINFFLKEASLFAILKEIDEKGIDYASSNVGGGKKVNIEFVSANPTGPLSVAHGRQAALGDTLSNILTDQGYKVTKEYYINDEGVQIDLLGESTQARYRQILKDEVSFPANGYHGHYVKEIAQAIFEQEKENARHKDIDFFSQFAVEMILEQIKKDLRDFGVNFDVWFSQKELTKEGIKQVIDDLAKKGYILEQEGAVFFKSTDFGDDKNRVVIKSDGKFTYFAWDIAYHQNKHHRSFTRLVNLWGPDHHGYVSRIKAALQALGYSPENISILIVQLVTLYRGKEKVKMSTRAGEFVSLRQLVEEIGKDAGRFFFVSRRSDNHLDFDLELAKKKNLENPVYYVQYAHARICNIIEFAKESNPSIEFDPDGQSLLNKKKEIELIKKLGEFSDVLKLIARRSEPHRLTIYLQELASAFHSFYDQHRVVTEDKKLTSVRLLLINCTKTVLQKGLNLLGISAPQRM